ncbi:MAG: hypothetical protein CVU61_00760 [Deltaproteobacteria bacterium HGW-Deltaproteobacteria-19]|nr:MAG: hypothetical protein CVU61_00760 [Deltaproteobacteria bacterium HGW-Deltaproteobacteria-19]
MATAEDFADILSLENGASANAEETTVPDQSGSDLPSTGIKGEGTGLLAVLEKLSSRSALRPEVRGLQNAVQHIRENLERRGYLEPALPVGADESLVESPVTADESLTATDPAENGVSETEALNPAEASGEPSPELEVQIAEMTEDLSTVVDSQA